MIAIPIRTYIAIDPMLSRDPRMMPGMTCEQGAQQPEIDVAKSPVAETGH
jgi:hypothetical protein